MPMSRHIVSIMQATPKKTVDPRPVQITVRNPIAIDRAAQAVRDGLGRNITEAAENLIIASSDALREKQASASSAR